MSRMTMVALVLCGSFALSVVAAPSVATPPPPPKDGFHTPSWRVQCEVSGLGFFSCWVTKTNLFAQMNPHGRVVRAGPGDADASTLGDHSPFARQLLDFGRSWRYRTSFRCRSRTTGLTCLNRDRHGWSFARNGRRRLF